MDEWNAAKQCTVIDAEVLPIVLVSAKKLTGESTDKTVIAMLSESQNLRPRNKLDCIARQYPNKVYRYIYSISSSPDYVPYWRAYNRGITIVDGFS